MEYVIGNDDQSPISQLSRHWPKHHTTQGGSSYWNLRVSLCNPSRPLPVSLILDTCIPRIQEIVKATSGCFDLSSFR